VESQESTHIIDPQEAFEIIQSEHRLLKDELTMQSEMLRQRLAAMEDRDRQKADEMTSLKQNLETLSMELNESKVQQSEMERQVKYFKECSENADLLTAKLMEADDVIKAQNAMIRGLQSGNSAVPVQSPPIMTTDQSVMDELQKKDERIKRLEGSLASLESACGAMNGDRLKARNEAQLLAETNADLRELVTALQSQNEMDKAEAVAIRADLEQEIQILRDRVAAFENSYSGASFNVPGQEEEGTPTLRHRDAPQHHSSSTGRSADQWVECPRCHLPMVNESGPHPCPSIIDGLD